MKITDLLSKESIELCASAKDKNEVLNKVVDLMEKGGKLSDKKIYLDAVKAREEEGTTGVGHGIAIPHGRCSGVKEAGLAALVLNEGVEFEALDGNPVDVVFLIAAPEGSGNVHIQILSKLATMLMDNNFVSALKSAKTTEAFLQIIDNAENAKDEKDASKKK